MALVVEIEPQLVMTTCIASILLSIQINKKKAPNEEQIKATN